MCRYILPIKADIDLDDIADYCLEEWGSVQTQLYLTNLLECLQWLSLHPRVGLSAIEFSPHLKKYNFKAHTVFYEPMHQGIFIVRILGQMQDFGRHLYEK